MELSRYPGLGKKLEKLYIMGPRNDGTVKISWTRNEMARHYLMLPRHDGICKHIHDYEGNQGSKNYEIWKDIQV